jgi:hypothetical protein
MTAAGDRMTFEACCAFCKAAVTVQQLPHFAQLINQAKGVTVSVTM